MRISRAAGKATQRDTNDTPSPDVSSASEYEIVLSRAPLTSETRDNREQTVLQGDTEAERAASIAAATLLDEVVATRNKESQSYHERPESRGLNESKKRKRAASPPWTFPTATTATLKTADGRRISARFSSSAIHTSSATPVSSENDDGRVRSNSQSMARSRQPSPPWKKFAADGPASVVVDGKRKSGRVYKDLSSPPKRSSPRSANQAERGATLPKRKAGLDSQQKHHRRTISGSSYTTPGRPTNRGSSAEERIAELQAHIDAMQPSPVRKKVGRKPKYLTEGTTAGSHELRTPHHFPKHNRSVDEEPEVQNRTPKIKLRFSTARQIIPPPHPNALPPSPSRPPRLSVDQRMSQLELREMQLPYTENDRGPPDLSWFMRRAQKQAAEEGAARRRLLEETRPGGKLSREKLSLFGDPEQQPQPPPQYGHVDHVVAHVLHLRHLQQRETMHHRSLAKKIAQEALEFWKAMRGPTEEDIREQEDRMFKLIHKQIVADMRAKWDMVAAYVHQQRLERWEAEEELKRQQRLREKLEWSENMVARQRGEAESDSELVEDSTVDSNRSESEDESNDGEDEEGNMSEISSEDGSDAADADEGGEMDSLELEAYLKQRDEDPPDTAMRDLGDNTDDEPGAVPGRAQSASQHPDQDTFMTVHLDDPPGTESGDDMSTDKGEGISTLQRREKAHLIPSATDENSDQDQLDHLASAKSRSHRSSISQPNDTEDNVNLSSDESTDMDSDDYDSDEDMSSDNDDEDGSDEDEAEDENQDSDDGRAQKSSLLGFYSKKDIKAFGLPTPTTSAECDDRDARHETAAADSVNGQVKLEDVEAIAGSQQADETASEQDEFQDAEGQLIDELSAAAEPLSAPRTPACGDIEEVAVKQLVPSPSLLRGTLRSYQHAGLDWLASLYRSGTNGILADEMGLGKTIQTIALLAHLAEEHECWDTHLIIVPTSVVLNWVTEFQKFLPGFRVLGYYGTAEERAMKRRGWVNDPHHEQRDKRGYNVIITSYNVAVQDINALRNVQWHYLVLDEAHNIRNFQSQRWQMLIRLKTRARLLLTGTPLQNSLTELWSLLTFLTAGDDDPAHGDLEEFLSHWKEPVREIFDRGVHTLSDEAQRVVDQLHISLRPFLLRRLKTEVEKDLPKKTESVIVCKLSKRQRQLYQEYMSLAETRRSLTLGNAVSAGKVLLSLRRVCNHPDLFDPRPIQTSFAMEKSPLEDLNITGQLVRRLLGGKIPLPSGLRIVGNEQHTRYAMTRSRNLSAAARLRQQAHELEASCATNVPIVSTLDGCRALQNLRQKRRQLDHIRSCIRTEENIRAPIYGSDLRELVTVRNGKLYSVMTSIRPVVRSLRTWPALGRYPLKFGHTDHKSDWLLSKTSILQRSVSTAQLYAERMQDAIVKFAFCTPVATAPILDYAIPPRTQQLCRATFAYPREFDYAHEARIRTTIAFPDSRLLIYDSGKLQRLTLLLRELQMQGSRSLIFTQMTGTLDVLERFLNLLNLPYLRLDGATPIERRQLYSAEFNRPDSKYQCMILSSRAGGVGLNLTGASSVIFYDLDWNPQMDRQCMDRAHRIGQVRDVQVFKMVSEKTVEENILRRANQKSLLDQTVIQEGHFTTEYQKPARHRFDLEDDKGDDDDVQDEDVAAAIDRLLGNGANERATTHALESVEDQEDVKAAQQARKEEQNQDDADLNDRASTRGGGAYSSTPGMTPRPGYVEGEQEENEADDDRGPHVDRYMIRYMQYLLKDVPFVPPAKVKSGPDRREKKGTRKR